MSNDTSRLSCSFKAFLISTRKDLLLESRMVLWR